MSEDIEIINQNTRVEKIKNFFSNNKKKLVGSLVLILLAVFSYFGYQEYKKKQKLEIADIYNQITLKEITPKKLFEKKPGEALKLAVKRMLPGGVLGKKQLTKLKIYAGNDHPHTAQNPKVINLSKLNNKNLIRN